MSDATSNDKLTTELNMERLKKMVLESKVEALELQLKMVSPEGEVLVKQTLKDVFSDRSGLGRQRLADAMLLHKSTVGSKLSGYIGMSVFDLYLVLLEYPEIWDVKETVLEIGRLRHKKLAKEGHPRALGKKASDFVHPHSDVAK